MYLKTDQRVERMTIRLQALLHRDLTEEEQRYIYWLCSNDMETYEVFTKLFSELANTK